MQILGKRSKILLIAVAITMLVAIGVSFAMWDMNAVKATNGSLSTYANAKVGDIVEFGQYYQTGNKVSDEENAEYEKTPIEWIVVDKDERTGQLTLMSKYILACGSYFGNWYRNSIDTPDGGGYYYNAEIRELDGNPCNQAYVESTARAFLNNLERRDLGGDSYVSSEYKTSAISSNGTQGKLLASVGFSNKTYTIDNTFFTRPINNSEYRNRPATRGFFDEAFSDLEKTMIVPKVIAGYTGHRWPDNTHDVSTRSYVEGVVDNVWLPSSTELNMMGADDKYLTNPNDEAGTKVFEYLKGKTGDTLYNSLRTVRTPFAFNNGIAMNYSIPVYNYQSTTINEDISENYSSTDHYWTRSPASHNYVDVKSVFSSGTFGNFGTIYSDIGVRPCVILKY